MLRLSVFTIALVAKLFWGCGKGMERATENLDDAAIHFGNRLVEATGKIDPLALKQLINTNQSLQDKTKALEAELNKFKDVKTSNSLFWMYLGHHNNQPLDVSIRIFSA